MIITRIIQYEGDDEWLKKQLGNSLNDGVRILPLGTISVLTVGNCTMEKVFKVLTEESINDNPTS